ncbi:MAG: AAA family ATPase [Methanobacteriaceae archaeon]|nr:AAA family ATPase [Methanobacteriaceae archaeon]
MKVIGVTGMPGSGKGIVAGVAKSLGYEIIRMGDVIREEAKKRNAKIGDTAVQLRKDYGEFVVAERCIQKIKDISKDSSNHSDLFIIEGIRSPFEVEMFRENFPGFKVLSVNSSPDTRFRRLLNRKRADDSLDKSEFESRDKRELKFGIGEVIARADYMVPNEGSIKRFKNTIRSILNNGM